MWTDSTIWDCLPLLSSIFNKKKEAGEKSAGFFLCLFVFSDRWLDFGFGKQRARRLRKSTLRLVDFFYGS